MDQLGLWISTTCLSVGLITGYLAGFRSGKVAGELVALKSIRHRLERDHSHRRSRRSGDERHHRHKSGELE
jgi:hypothetical protein